MGSRHSACYRGFFVDGQCDRPAGELSILLSRRWVPGVCQVWSYPKLLGGGPFGR